MGNLRLAVNIPLSDTALARMPSDWTHLLPDPTMFDVSLYLAGHVYAARLQRQAIQFIVDSYQGRAIRSVRHNLAKMSNGLSDSLVAAILILTVIDVCLDI